MINEKIKIICYLGISLPMFYWIFPILFYPYIVYGIKGIAMFNFLNHKINTLFQSKL